MTKKLAVALAGLALLAGLAVLAFRSRPPAGSASTTAFDLPALDGGGRVRLAAYRGEPVVVTLYASWCTACLSELPGFARQSSRVRGKVQFIAVDSQETGDGAGFARRFGLSTSGFVLAKDIGQSSTGGLFKAYAARGLPVTVFYSRSGTIVSKALEGVPEDVLRQQLHTLYGV
jgi:thiol-disulfide isomerase/thioredoxin